MSYKLHPRLQNRTDNGYVNIKYKDIAQLFDMTSDNACKHLGISKTSLKKICRHFNISKWPYRRLCKNNTIIIKPAIPIKKMNSKKTACKIKYTNDLKYVKDPEIYNDLSFLTGLNITENPYELEKILLYFD
tara:strand:- start:104 stop:499 length:396 start_codon:yes stop_codon:yes gene_type:complete